MTREATTPDSPPKPAIAERLRAHTPSLVAFVSGVVLALSGPPLNAIPALWVGLAGLAWSLEAPARAVPAKARAPRLRAACAGGMRGWLFGLGANLVAFRFVPAVITRFTPLPTALALLALVLLAAAQALVWFFAAVVATRLVARGVPRWAAFAVGAYAGSFFPMVFPWSPGAGASAWPILVQTAELVGERGVTFAMAVTAGLLVEARRSGGAKKGLAAVGLVAATLAYGAWRMARVDALRERASTAKLALVEPAIGASERWEAARAKSILAGLTELTVRAEAEGVELTVWPESAYPYVQWHGAHRDAVGPQAILQPGVHGPVLTGLLLSARGPDGNDETNSALVAERGGSLGPSYDKMHLLWFGEEVPLADVFPVLRHVFARAMGLAPGDHQVLLTSGRLRMAVLNCFEDTLPGAGREAMGVGPNLLVNVTNDAWFADPKEPGAPEPKATANRAFSLEGELHLRMGAMRSVEARRDLVRAVNLGPTSWVDSAGRVRAVYASHTPGYLIVTPALLDGPLTFFSRFGDAPWALGLVIGLVVLERRARTKSKGARPR